MLTFIVMSKRTISSFICLLLLPTLFPGVLNYAGMGSGSSPLFDLFPGKAQASFEEPCDMDHCNPYMPRCPLCPSSGSSTPYLRQVAGDYLPTITTSLVLVSVNILSDQGYITSVFRPPAFIS
jgi:hypothetical protein